MTKRTRVSRTLPPASFEDSETGERENVYEALPFRVSATLIGRSLMGISFALHRIADTLEKDSRAAYLDRPE